MLKEVICTTAMILHRYATSFDRKKQHLVIIGFSFIVRFLVPYEHLEIESSSSLQTVYACERFLSGAEMK